jgi:tyrosinase
MSMARKYTSQSLQLGASFREDQFYRADIEFHAIDHSGATFEARIFFNNPDATETTESTLENGYAGSFYIFGHGGCFGDAGHCNPRTGLRNYDKRRPHPLTLTDATVTVTNALRTAARKGSELTVTVVPVIMSANALCDLEECLKFKNFNIVIYGHPNNDLEA